MDKLKKAMLRAERDEQARPAPPPTPEVREPPPLVLVTLEEQREPLRAEAPEERLRPEPGRPEIVEPPKPAESDRYAREQPRAFEAAGTEVEPEPPPLDDPLIEARAPLPESAPWEEDAVEWSEPGDPAEGSWDTPPEPPSPGNASRGDLLALLELEQAAEPLRMLRAQILSRAENGGGGSLLVTSANPGEGKTFTALSLAASIAEQGERAAVLVEADWSGSSMLSRLGLRATQGLSDYLLEAADLDDVLVDPGYENLTLLPAGTPPPGSSDLVGSPRMKAALAEVRSRHPGGFVIVDGPSLLSGADAVLLSLLVDGVLLVVEAEVTPEADLAQAVEALGGRPVVGIVYNKSRR